MACKGVLLPNFDGASWVVVKPDIGVQRRPQLYARLNMLALQYVLDAAVDPFWSCHGSVPVSFEQYFL